MNKELKEIKRQLMNIDYICTGTILLSYKKCGKPNCLCMTEKTARHGPYYVWTRKVKGKTITKTLSQKQASICKKYINNMKRLKSLIEKIKIISLKAIEKID